jgi:hypothetical protein
LASQEQEATVRVAAAVAAAEVAVAVVRTMWEEGWFRKLLVAVVEVNQVGWEGAVAAAAAAAAAALTVVAEDCLGEEVALQKGPRELC